MGARAAAVAPGAARARAGPGGRARGARAPVPMKLSRCPAPPIAAVSIEETPRTPKSFSWKPIESGLTSVPVFSK